MTAKILSAAPVVAQIKKDLILRCETLKAQGIVPSMCVVLVGDNSASMSYIKNKKKMCEEIGAKFQLLHLADTTEELEFLHKIEELNKNDDIHGIIIQLPVSEKLKTLHLPNLINQEKDIDGFHGLNTQNLYAGSTDLSLLLPCTPKGIINLLKHYQISLSGKHVVVVGRSLIVGKPMAMLLSNFDATVTQTHSQTMNLKKLTQQADIVISAIGKPHFFDHSYFDPAKKTIVIDVGMNTINGKLAGDVNQKDVMECLAAISPVPGGVGPMTVISLIENLIAATEKKIKGQI
jgi:methylenetetrahydrofolate dehydrogenase (NADP+)/methenyltetrahydrofolate cyclohydrolase